MSSTIPAGIILVNNDINENIINTITQQLFIDGYMDGYHFDNIILDNPDYPFLVKQLNRRILVFRPLNELNNRELFDVVCFFKHGLLSVEINKFGPHGITVPLVSVTWQKLCIYNI
jgi:hypothetical protein